MSGVVGWQKEERLDEKLVIGGKQLRNLGFSEELTIVNCQLSIESRGAFMEEKTTVTIRLPLTRELREDVFVGINGKSWLIKRGETVEVPWNVAKVLSRREKCLAEAMEFEALAAQPLESLEAR